MGKRDHADSDKHHKSSKKESSHKRSKKDRDSEDEESEDETPLVSNPISSDDFYLRSSEFIVWLREKKSKTLSDLSSKDAHKYFEKFVKKWNRNELNKKFYAGIAVTDIASNERSKHKWNFKVSAADEAKLVAAKDSVHAMTATKLEDERRGGRRDMNLANPPNLGPRPSRDQDDEDDMDPEDRARYERALRKKDNKSFDSTRKAALEELAPKATGREAQLEKKKAVNAYHKQERDTDLAIKDSDLMGGGDSFSAHMAREKQRKERYEERKQQANPTQRVDLDSRVQNYKAKEDATMAMFRDMAAKKFVHHFIREDKPAAAAKPADALNKGSAKIIGQAVES
ncbi:hypothetical protein HDU98_007918 [Podochytrium sp. JEL0797]|nr:hypothetical protein HDU98_007918 [Podochytrium sp. JEL0797]